LVACFFALSGCGSGSTGPELPEIDPTAAAAQAMTAYDANSDGLIGGAELQKSPPLNEALARIDANADRMLSQEEISAYINKYLEHGVALYPYRCRVTLDGRALSGATVRLVPESFLGPALKPAAGVTDADGMVAPVIDSSLSGAYCGLYRVEISKKTSAGQEMLPSRFNSQTTLAQELGPGIRSAEGGAEFTLKSQ
jgi:hypothetical protein